MHLPARGAISTSAIPALQQVVNLMTTVLRAPGAVSPTTLPAREPTPVTIANASSPAPVPSPTPTPLLGAAEGAINMVASRIATSVLTQLREVVPAPLNVFVPNAANLPPLVQFVNRVTGGRADQ